MPWSISTQPAPDAEALDAVKDQVRERGDHFDAELTRIITESIRFVQEITNRQLMNATAVYTLERFPGGSAKLFLPPSPLVSVTSVTYTDTSDVSQTWSGSSYDTTTNTEPGYLRPVYNTSYPTDTRGRADVIVTYVVGYGTGWESVDPKAQRLVLMQAETLFRGTDWGELWNQTLSSVSVGDDPCVYV